MDMNKMKEISQALADIAACGEYLTQLANSTRELLEEKAEPDTQPAPKAAEPAREEQPKKYTFAEVRKAFSAKSHEGYTEQVKALITQYGAEKLSAVKEEDYPAIMKDLEAIV